MFAKKRGDVAFIKKRKKVEKYLKALVYFAGKSQG